MEPAPVTENRTWAMAAHLAALAGYFIPFGWIIGPLVVWQVKKDDPLVVDQGKESVNFQITMILYTLVAGVLVLAAGLGLLLLMVLPTYQIIMIVVGAVRANSGERYRYPATLRLVK